MSSRERRQPVDELDWLIRVSLQAEAPSADEQWALVMRRRLLRRAADQARWQETPLALAANWLVGWTAPPIDWGCLIYFSPRLGRAAGFPSQIL